MKRKRSYSATDVEQCDVSTFLERVPVDCIVAVDVAKTKFVAALASAAGETLKLVKFEHPRQTAAFVGLLQALQRAERRPVVVMEPTGTYGDLPAPTRDQLQALVSSVARRATGWLRRQGHLSDEDTDAGAELTALDACVALAMQRTKLHKLERVEADDDDDPEPPSLAHRAVEDGGFNLRAGVRIRDDLARERLCRYALRPAVALSRLRRLRDGRVAYRVKRAQAGKAKHMVLTPLELLARIAALVPPPRYPLVRYHGVLAPRSSWRRLVVPRPREPRPCPPLPRALTSPAGHRSAKKDAPPRRAEPPASSPPPPGRPKPAPKNEHLAGTPDLEVQRLAPNVLSVQHWHRLELSAIPALTALTECA